MENLNLVVGAVKGRHEMPCNDYIFDSEVNPLDLKSIYNRVEEKLNGAKSVILYVTGLTVIKYCFNNEIELVLMHFDRDSNSYYPQILF